MHGSENGEATNGAGRQVDGVEQQKALILNAETVQGQQKALRLNAETVQPCIILTQQATTSRVSFLYVDSVGRQKTLIAV